MFFSKKKLYEAKQRSLVLGVQFIHMEAHMMRDALPRIRAELNEINNQLLQRRQHDRSMPDLVHRRIALEHADDAIRFAIPQLFEIKEKIIAQNNANYSTTLNHVSYTEWYHSRGRETLPSFFSPALYQQRNQIQTALSAAEKNELKMIDHRIWMTGLFGGLLIAAPAVLLAMALSVTTGILLSLFLNLLVVEPLIFIFTTCIVTYTIHAVSNFLASVMRYEITINEQIDVGASNPWLFSELDQLNQTNETQVENELRSTRGLD